MGNAAEYVEVIRQLGGGHLRPIMDQVFPLAQARDAFQRLAQGEQLGKICVEIAAE